MILPSSADARIFAAMKRTTTVCSWCLDAQERTAAAMVANGGHPISHGICAACAARMEAE